MAAAPLGTAKALFDYEAQDDSCIDLAEGQMIQLLEVDDGPWWKGRVNDKEGWFPSSFVEMTNISPIPPSPRGPVDASRRPRSVKYRSNAFQTRATDARIDRASVVGESGSARAVLVDPANDNAVDTSPVTPLLSGSPIPRKMTITRPETQRVHEAVVLEKEELTNQEKFNYFFAREGNVVGFFIFYVLLNSIYFGVTWETYRDRDTFDVLGNGLTLARSSGALLKLNMAFIFFTVCRGLLTWARGQPILARTLPLDMNIKLHKYMAYWIWILSLLHCFAHVFNFNKLSDIEESEFDEYFPDVDRKENFATWLFGTVPGFTGVIIWVSQMLMYSSAMESCRHRCFEVFWFTHHLFIVFTVATLIHGSAAVFEAPGFWKWLVIPGTIYLVERMFRVLRGARETVLHHVTGENSGVTALYMVRNRDLQYKAGQYIFINCPKLAKYQWHPFTITSSPEEKYLSCHIKAVGTWTRGIQELFNPDKKLGDITIDKWKDEQGRALIRVDGPFGAPSEHVFDSRVAVLIGAGIGVTPFASILKSMFYKLLLMQSAPKQYHLELMRVEKVHFYWICRDRTSFEWFAFMLRDLEDRAKGFLEVHTYITARFDHAEIKTYLGSAYGETTNGEYDPLTGLKTRTYFGRPDFGKIFGDMATLYPGENVGVFFCGPKVMSRNIRKHAKANSTPGGTSFTFRKENF